MSNRQAIADLRIQVEQRAKPLRRDEASLRERCEERAAKLYNVAIKGAGLSQRAAARRFDLDERLVRDAASGARAVHLWQILALPVEGRIAFMRELLALAPDDEESEEARCA